MMERPGAGARPVRSCAAPRRKACSMARSALLAGLGALALASARARRMRHLRRRLPVRRAVPPQTVDADPDLGAAWLDNGRMIGLVTLGSSTCVPPAESADGQRATACSRSPSPTPDADQACTADLVPRVTLVTVPEDVDPAQDLTIEVTGDNYSTARSSSPASPGSRPAARPTTSRAPAGRPPRRVSS